MAAEDMEASEESEDVELSEESEEETESAPVPPPRKPHTARSTPASTKGPTVTTSRRVFESSSSSSSRLGQGLAVDSR